MTGGSSAMWRDPSPKQLARDTKDRRNDLAPLRGQSALE